MPGHLVTADSTAEAAQCLAQQVFYVKDKNRMQSIRQRHPIFLLDAQAQQLHGVFQRTLDAQQLLQDLTQAPGQRGYQVSKQRCGHVAHRAWHMQQPRADNSSR